MSAAIDITGRRYGFLTAIEQVDSDARGNAQWRCRCACGALVVVARARLQGGTTRSCGCRRAAMRRHALERKRRTVTSATSRWLTRAQAIALVLAATGATTIASATVRLRDLRVSGAVRTKPTGGRYWAFGAHREELLFNRADLRARCQRVSAIALFGFDNTST